MRPFKLLPFAFAALLTAPGAAAESTSTTSSSASSSTSSSASSSTSSSDSSGRSSSSQSTDGIVILTGTNDARSTSTVPSSLYDSVTTTIALPQSTTITLESTTITSALSPTQSNDTSADTSTATSSSGTVTFLSGSIPPSSTVSGNSTITGARNSSTSVSTSSTSAPQPTNTTPCNNHPEFCARKYSNITVVGCHNSPFVRTGSAASNQAYTVKYQLNDGIRFLQAQMQWPSNGTVPHFCHTSCDILDAGPITDWLGEVKNWVADHPYDVVTILLGNGNYSAPSLYVPHIEASGILEYVYTPPKYPMALEDWPTLSNMILSSKRVVMFLDYKANETEYPWFLDEFTQMWETPFDPTDRTFPCTVDRPPKLNDTQARDRLYLVNHNLNVEISLLGTKMLVPDFSELNVTNNVSGYGSLGLSANNCRSDWGRAPNILNVDYYNYGGYPGSVFEVAALMNNVTYDQQCCGVASNDAVRVQFLGTLSSFTLGWLLFWLWI